MEIRKFCQIDDSNLNDSEYQMLMIGIRKSYLVSLAAKEAVLVQKLDDVLQLLKKYPPKTSNEKKIILQQLADIKKENLK